MGIFDQLVTWTTETFKPLGIWGLFILAVIEASFFPIPVDILLAILVIENPGNTLLYATIAVVGSVLGGIIGYGIGKVGEHVVLEKLVSKKKIEQYHRMVEKYGSWAVFIAGFTPIPYKLATIGAGVFYINFKNFVFACILGRTLRFFSVAYIVKIFGEEMLDFFDKNLVVLTAIFIVALAIYIMHRKRKSIKSSS